MKSSPYSNILVSSRFTLSLAPFIMGLWSFCAQADSLWIHNGSVMRLHADGNSREFVYEEPSSRMRHAGVSSGDTLFEGTRDGNRYYGTARVFSKDCDHPLEFEVSGNVVSEKHVVLHGTREIFAKGCRPTGRMTDDTLEFRYKQGK